MTLQSDALPSSHDVAALVRECARCGARGTSVCAAVEDEDLARLAVHSQHVSLAPGQSFIEQDEPAEDFFIVTEGHAKLYTLMADGRRQVMEFVARGSFLGLAAVERYVFSAEAITPLRLCRFSHAGMRLLLAQFPALERRLLREASRELTRAQARMLLLGRKMAAERVASFLLEQAAVCPGISVFALPMTRSDIADYLGLTIETVSRTMSRLRHAGLIEIDQITHIRLMDRAALTALSVGEGEPLV